ncbi:MAG: DUF4296 domain-containing protein [Opitutaceae bacterium]|nr:DUF4296 domain-containing protein [Cytophagales bacterium]
MNKLLIGLLLLMIFSACKKETQTEANVLEKEKMVTVLTQLHLAEAYVNANYTFSDSARYLYKSLEDSILKSQGTNLAVFDSSLAYYQKDVKSMDEIYAASIDSLSLMEGISK